MGGIPEGCRDCQKANRGVTASSRVLCKRHERQAQRRDDALAAAECLEMVRETLEELGLDMSGTPPMMYNDAVRQLASILGRKAGLLTGLGIAGVVAEHEAARKLRGSVPTGEKPRG